DLSECGDSGAAVPVRGGRSGARAAAHAYLDARQDRTVRRTAGGGAAPQRPASCTSSARRRSLRAMRYPAAMMHHPTPHTMRLASALMSGLTPSFTFE